MGGNFTTITAKGRAISMHNTNSNYAEILQKIMNSIAKPVMVVVTVVLCVPQIAYADDDSYNSTVIGEFGLLASEKIADKSKSTYNNEQYLGIDNFIATSKDFIKIQDGVQYKSGNSYARGYAMAQNFAYRIGEEGDSIIGIRLCPVIVAATVDKECTDAEDCDGGSNARDSHLLHLQPVATHNYPDVPRCQWFCANGWTGVGSNSYYSDGWCSQEIKGTQDFRGMYGYIDSLEDYRQLVRYITSGSKSDDHSEKIPVGAGGLVDAGNKRNTSHAYNEFARQYIVAVGKVEHGIKVGPVVIRSAVTTDGNINKINAYPLVDLIDETKIKTFCLPGYQMNKENQQCEKIPTYAPCYNKGTPEQQGYPDANGWKSAGSDSNYETKGYVACICKSTTDMSDCEYHLIDKYPTAQCSDGENSAPCWFKVGGKIAYYYNGSYPSDDNSLCRCKVGFYGKAKAKHCVVMQKSSSNNFPTANLPEEGPVSWDSTGCIVGCFPCTLPTFCNNISGCKWVRGVSDSCKAEQMCNLAQTPTGDNEASCKNKGDGYSWFEGACYQWLTEEVEVDIENNKSVETYFILPQTQVCTYN